MNLKDELMRVDPDAASLVIGGHKVFRLETTTPAHHFISLVSLRSDNTVAQITSRDSFEENLAKHLLDFADSFDFSGMPTEQLSVSPSRYPTPYTFESVVVVPPLIAKRFENRSIDLQRATFWLLPAFKDEFANGGSSKDFWHQIDRKDGWRVHVVDWSRKPKTEPVWD